MTHQRFTLGPIFIFCFLLSTPLLASQLDCLRTQLHHLDSKMNSPLQSKSQSSKIMRTISNSSDSKEIPLFEVSTRIDHFQFLKFVYHSLLNTPLPDDLEFVAGSVCAPYILEKQVNSTVTEVLCRKWVASGGPMVEFMRTHKLIGSKVFGDVFYGAVDQELEKQLKQLKQTDEIHFEGLSEPLSQEEVIKVLTQKYLKIYDDIYAKFADNISIKFESIIRNTILTELKDNLKIFETLKQSLNSMATQTYEEKDLILKEEFLLISLFSSKLGASDLLLKTESIQDLLKKMDTRILENKMNSIFFQRLPDQILSSLDKSHADLSLFFELTLLPTCFGVLNRQQIPLPVQRCKEIFTNVFDQMFNQHNTMITESYQVFILSPDFVKEFRYFFEKHFLSLERNAKGFDPLNLEKHIKSDVFNYINVLYGDLIKLGFTEFANQQKSDNQVEQSEGKYFKLSWALLPEIKILARKLPFMVKNYLLQNDVMATLTTQLKSDPWFLNETAGRLYVEKLKLGMMQNSQQQEIDLESEEFVENLTGYSVQMLAPELQEIMELVVGSVHNIKKLIPLRNHHSVYRLVAQVIEDQFKSVDISRLDSRATDLANRKIETVISEIEELTQFYFSPNFHTLFQKSDEDSIASTILQHMTSNRQEQQKLAVEFGNQDYIVSKRLKHEQHCFSALVSAFNSFYDLKKTNPDLTINQIMKEYSMFTLIHHNQYLQVKTIEDPLLKELNAQMAFELRLKYDQSALVLAPFLDLTTMEAQSPSMLKSLSNSLVSMVTLPSEMIKQILLLPMGESAPELRTAINKCRPEQIIIHETLKLCSQENPDYLCQMENNFLVQTKCPVGTDLLIGSNLCIESCPKNFEKHLGDGRFCKKPMVTLREIISQDLEMVIKPLNDEEDSILNHQNSRNSLTVRVKQGISVESNKIFKKVKEDFKNQTHQDSKSQKTDALHRKFRLSECPQNYQAVSLICVPVCPEGWPDRGVFCEKPMYHKVRKYLIDIE